MYMCEQERLERLAESDEYEAEYGEKLSSFRRK